MNDDPWPSMARLLGRLEAYEPLSPERRIERQALKLMEEVGELAQALSGVTGSNPRKGVDHTWHDVEAEVCDVIITGMVALTALAGDEAPARFTEHLNAIRDRDLTDDV